MNFTGLHHESLELPAPHEHLRRRLEATLTPVENARPVRA